MAENPYQVSPGVLRETAYGTRWTALARADLDLATIATWDRHLPRHKRILVPVDVQALVVPRTGGEPVVPVGGVDGDPDPLADGTDLRPGVHLHWALPDALLRGRHDRDAEALRMPTLPDRWVVVRTVYPEGRSAVHLTGWVVDAAAGTVLPLAEFSGTPARGAPEKRLDPLDGSSRGSLLWTATYAGARGRFTLHDPLTDLADLSSIAPQGLHLGRAAYTVCGWWSEPTQDPFATCRSTRELDRTGDRLGWELSPDGEDALEEELDPRIARLHDAVGLDTPDEGTDVTTVRKYSTSTVRHADLQPRGTLAMPRVAGTYLGRASTTYHSLLHGCVVGVPVDGTSRGTDERPAGTDTSGAIGLDVDDVAAALAAPGLGLDAAHRQSAERLTAAFTSDLLSRLASPDGLADLEEREHADGFWSFAGRPLPMSRPDRLRAEDSTPFGPTRVGRKGRGTLADSVLAAPEVRWGGGVRGLTGAAARAADGIVRPGFGDRTYREQPATPPKRVSDSAPSAGPASREVPRAAPRLFRPAPAVIGIRGLKPSHRHHGDGRFEDGAKLRCRYAGESVTEITGVVSGPQVVPTIGNGAVPREVLDVVRESVLLNGYAYRWLAAAGETKSLPFADLEVRMRAETVRLYGTRGTYDASGAAAIAEARAVHGPQAPRDGWAAVGVERAYFAGQVAAEVARFSILKGTPPSPVAVTTWRQPWVPTFLEWEVDVTGSEDLDGWVLDGLDLAGAPTGAGVTRTLTGRSPISRGVGTALTEGIRRWLAVEQQRDLTVPSTSQLSDRDEAALARIADLLAPLDVVSASLDGVREQLLGIAYSGIVVRRRGEDGAALPPAPGVPVPLFGGALAVRRLRVVDAFGRTLEVPAGELRTTTRLEVDGSPSTVRLTPRVLHGARWLLRLVDPAHGLDADPADAAEAWIDQVHADVAVNPVSGFLLPDHIDEACEVFDRGGNPLGQVMHDTVTDAVTWEPAPGRPLPPDAGPLADVPAHAQHVALLAAGLVRADVDARQGAAPGETSSLTALLRAVDTTLWSVDTYAALGSPSIAGLVGRPIAVLRATLRLDAPDDLAEVEVTGPGGPQARAAAYASLSRHRFPVRVGDLGRTDDAVLGFFVDDDYGHFHVVDKVVAATARDTGRHRGQLGLLGGGSTAIPGLAPLDHPYLELEDTLFVRVGQTVRLSILMLPGGKVHLTSGILPRKALALADDWVTPGLTRLVPSMRVGPVLVDPAEIRLPKVASFGKDQVFTRRTGPLTWRDDPIVSATSSALLPRMPHEAQEGWIRVAPAAGPDGAATPDATRDAGRGGPGSSGGAG